MIRCSKCGTVNTADASFCSECNTYLEWSSERLEAEPADDRAPDQPLEPPAGDNGGDDEGGAAPHGDEAPPLSVVAPTVADVPAARKPERSPGSPTPKPKPTPLPRDARAKPGERVCPACGSGNDPTRKFCRRCGGSLVEAAIEPLPPRQAWYRRIRPGGTASTTYAAGARPENLGRQRHKPGCLLIVVVILVFAIAAAGLAYAFNGVARSAVDDTIRIAECRVRELLAEPTVAVITSPAAGEYGYAAVDKVDTTWSATRRVPLGGGRVGAFDLPVVLDRPAFVYRIEVTPAASTPRPRFVRVHDHGKIAEGVLPNDGKVAGIEVCRRLDSFSLRIVTTYPDGAPSAGIRLIVVRVSPEGR